MSSLNLGLVLAWRVAAALPSDAPPTGEEQIQRWIQTAKLQHPQALAARADLEAAQAETQSAKAWMPPSTQVQYQSDGRVDLSVSQMIPWPGKVDKQMGIRGAKVEMTRADSAEQLRKMSLAIREAAWMEWMAYEKIKVSVEQETLAVRLADAVRRTQAQGMSTASESWLAQAKGHQARLETERLRAEARSATAMRESWTGLDSPLVALKAEPPQWKDSLLLLAATHRPDIESMSKEALMLQAMGEAMKANLRPDIMVGAMVMRMESGMPGWGVMAGLTLPFVPWARGMATGEAAGAHSRSRSSQSRAAAMNRMAQAEIADHSAKAKSAWTTLVELESSVVPGQDRALADARSRYAQGREMLTMIFSMQDMVRMTAMEAVMRRTEYELERARLLAAAGLESWEQVGK